MHATRGSYTLSDDPARLDVDAIQQYLSRSYWAEGIPRDVVERSIQNSLCFGIYVDDRQVGFARVVTDRATFGYLSDVYVLEEHRGAGLGKWLVGCVHAHPELQGLRRWMLMTRDAHELYRQFGWTPMATPERCMERHVPGMYVPTGRS